MWHPDDDVGDTAVCRLVEELVEEAHHALGAFTSVAFHSGKLGGQEMVELLQRRRERIHNVTAAPSDQNRSPGILSYLGLQHDLGQPPPLLLGEIHVLQLLEAVSEPQLLLQAAQLVGLHGQVAAVGLLQVGLHLVHRGLRFAKVSETCTNKHRHTHTRRCIVCHCDSYLIRTLMRVVNEEVYKL